MTVETQQDSNSAAGGASVLTEMLGVVRSADDATKARIWCALNRHEWPGELADLKPASFDDMTGDARHMLVWKLMCEASDAIGIGECLREWNRDTLPGEQFDAWWNNGCRAPTTPNAK